MIRWLVQSNTDHPDLAAGRVPAGLLNAAEAARLAAFTHPKRRRDWLLGRWTAKLLLQAHLTETTGECLALETLVIDNDPDGAPYAQYVDGAGVLLSDRRLGQFCDRLPVSLSISHSNGYAFCAVCDLATVATRMEQPADTPQTPLPQVGADIELVEPRARQFVEDFFTRDEIRSMRNAPPDLYDLLVTAVWSAKEAVLKALHLGLRVDTRCVDCQISPCRPRDWEPFAIRLGGQLDQTTPGHAGSTRALYGWWRTMCDDVSGASFVLTLVAADGEEGVSHFGCPASEQ